MLIWIPSPFWLVLIPLNYLIDLLVLKLSLKGREVPEGFARDNTWKICIAGFVSDLAGAAALLAIMLIAGSFDGPIIETIAPALNMNPFRNVWSFLACMLGIFIAALVIFFLDRTVLKKSGLDESIASHSALMLAVFTAPYLFLFPSAIIYSVIGA